jgi:cyclopropane fatty-acyl-phospholipid synthase-like methyltransferase
MTISQLPFSQACENNKDPILSIINTIFSISTHLLEIGTGTGQHAIHFAKHLPHLTWQTSDQNLYLEGIKLQLASTQQPNLPMPLALDVAQDWPLPKQALIDAVFTANTLHIMSEEMVEAFFEGVGIHLQTQGQLCIYGPFNYAGKYTSESNAIFDIRLAQQDPRSAIRDIEWVRQLADNQGLELINDHAMPANNRLLHFVKVKPKISRFE